MKENDSRKSVFIIRLAGTAMVLSAFALFAACSSAGRDSTGSHFDAPAWPPPPMKTRIVFRQMIRNPSDWGFKRSFPSRVWDIVAGKRDDVDFVSPYAVAGSPEGMTAVTDTTRGAIYLFDPSSDRFRIIHRYKKQRILSPVGAAFDGNRNLYVSDSRLGKILVFDGKGRFKRIFAPNTVFKRPTGIAINREKGRIYIVDTIASQVIIMDLEGNERGRFGEKGSGKGQMNYPTHIALAGDGTVIINDALNFRIQLFNENGDFVSMFGQHGDGTGDFSRPRGLAVDSKGHIYVSDALFDVVQIFDRSGNYLLSFGGTGGEIGQMFMPAGIAISQSDQVTVADQGNRRLQTFQYLHLPEGEEP